MAFKNTLYHERAMQHVSTVPPTRLTLSYYSCVMSRWEATYAASGLAASNTQLYVGLGLLVYMYLAMYFLHFFTHKKDAECQDNSEEVRWKMAKLKEEEMKREHIEDFIFALQRDIVAGRIVSLNIFCLDWSNS